MEEIKIRKLKVSDRKRLSKLVTKLADVMGDESLLNVISSAAPEAKAESGAAEGGEDNAVKIGIKVIRLLLETLEDETHAWFSDLIGVKPEQFLDLPLDTELKILDQLVNASEASNFFTLASQLYKKTEKLRGKFNGAKTV